MTRRELVATAAVGAGGLTLGAATPGWARKRPPRLLRAATFPSGVMAGEPGPRGALLWTQLGEGEQGGRLRLEIAADPDFRRVVHRELVAADGSRDLVARRRLCLRRLRPGEHYWYRFETRSGSSPVGRFTTARPADSTEPVRIGFFSCQGITSGYFTAHAGLAAEDCDLIVALGDYYYETNADSSAPGRDDRTSAGANGQCELLDEYRAKYRLYRSDADLRAMHGSAAMAATWDDHEVEDNYVSSHQGVTPYLPPIERRIPFEQRKRNAYAAWFEQMPLAVVPAERTRLYRRYRLGGMVELFMLDLRQYRDDQACLDVPSAPCPEEDDPHRTALGAEQKRWLKDGLAGSPAAWKLLASSVMMMDFDTVPGVLFWKDAWGSYRAERRELGEHLLVTGTRDVAVISGDQHFFAAGPVTTDGHITGRPFATEFMGGAITSAYATSELEALSNAHGGAANPHWAFHEFARRGYGMLDARPDELRVRFRSPVTVNEPKSTIETIAEFRVPRGQTGVERVA